ncbi:metal-dependent hydrolase [Flavobacteriaceae bacterium XHP0103]|uniref:metal-dependent hydrolase n=1 Tax=Marixanthotalea marina TaxID=2844359 RepID=UPI002989C063|nr:metal-dependent hydrolase [Marixanthotalea marina]MBU3821617.1 metal-dependent hydrolase [Marixanthotalea marina]
MFIGHYALAFGAKKKDALPSLAMLFIAVQFLDLLWPIFVLLGVETFQVDPGNTALTPLNFTYYPYSHSLLMAVVWGLLLGIVYFAFTKNKKGALLLGILVFSHWVLDFITHRPDLPLSPFSNTKVGLGLWNSPIAEIILEVGLFLVGVYFYFKNLKPKRKTAFWLLVVFFLVIHLMNVFGPPPPSIAAVAWSANLMWLFVLWAWWIERK